MRRSSFLLVGSLVAIAASASGQALRVPVTVDTLPNGLRLIVHEDHSAPIVTVNTWFSVGSASEAVGLTGLAHLFEHLMFMGSQHAPYPQFDRLLEAAGANNNASTWNDRTDYYEAGPITALPLMLWLDADRMGWFLPVMDAAKVDAQRDIVKNERRQSYENQPYGMAEDVIPKLMFPAGHPYSWPVIGSMIDLSRASLDDVRNFFRKFYAPNNATIAIVGDVTRDSVLKLVKHYFGAIPRGPAIDRPSPAPARKLVADTMVVLEDAVQVARLQYLFPAVAGWTADDAPLRLAAYILSGTKNSRLDQRLVYDDQIASSVSASAQNEQLAGYFDITAMPRPGKKIPDLQRAIDAELLRLANEGPTPRELEQAKNAAESRLLGSIETVEGKANRLNKYFAETGTADAFQKDLDRTLAITADDIKRVVRQYLLGPRAILTVVPAGKRELAATPRSGTP